jgi:hypothetical protein
MGEQPVPGDGRWVVVTEITLTRSSLFIAVLAFTFIEGVLLLAGHRNSSKDGMLVYGMLGIILGTFIGYGVIVFLPQLG